MSSLVTVDNKGRIPIQGSQPGQKFVVTKSGGEWRVSPYIEQRVSTRNSNVVAKPRGKKNLLGVIKEMGKAGLQIERPASATKTCPSMQVLKYLLDTNVVSDWMRGVTPVSEWLATHSHEVALSTLTIAEIRRGIELLPEGKTVGSSKSNLLLS